MRNMLNRLKGRTALLIAGAATAAAIVGVSGGAAYAVITGATSGTAVQHSIARNDTALLVPGAANTWQTVSGMVRTVSVPSGQRRLFIATYTAESQCTGGSWCSVRIVVRNNATGAVSELLPASGTDYAFDAPSTDLWEGHARTQSTNYLPAGSYTFSVQANRVGGSTFRLDDMHFEVVATT
ncbi:MAG TPA: hypothetical protein VLA88_03695 [Candidatus Saccharimonadales bacterium]|nr:hypothetical protein [Candidatus Saccharimonadales bacterium]